MVVIKNVVKRVIVLKAYGKGNSNLFCKPGTNRFPDIKSIDPYVKANKAAQGFFDEGDLILVSASKPKFEPAGLSLDEQIKKAQKALIDAEVLLDNAQTEEEIDAATVAIEQAQAHMNSLSGA